MRLPRALIGKIVLARFLQKTPGEIERVVGGIENAPLYRYLAAGNGEGGEPLVRTGGLEDARYEEACGPLSSRVAGVLMPSPKGLRWFYRSRALIRQYSMDKQAIAAAIADGRLTEDESSQLSRLLRAMRLVNTRNRLGHAVLQAVVDRQMAYLASLDARLLRPLRQVELATALAAEASGAGGLDPSRVSRLVRSMSLLLPDNRELPLQDLFPDERSLIETHLRNLLWEERKEAAAGNLPRPFADSALADRIRERTGSPCSRRTVAYAREGLGVPCWRERAGLGCYLAATEGFSELHPLEREVVRALVPRVSGVYELRLADGTIDYPMGACPVFYLGSAVDLRKRLVDHLGRGARNRGIRGHVTNRNVLFRFVCVKMDWRDEERRVYNRFEGTFGESPRCNESKP